MMNQPISLQPLLQKRWSPRAFDSRSIEPDKLKLMLEALRWAPSCFNEQPWHVIIATKEKLEVYDRLLSCLVEANQLWAKNAPVLMLSVAKLNFSHNAKENRHAWHDVGLAMENLTIQGMALDIYVHQMAGFDPQAARDLFQIPPDFAPVAMSAIGYLGDPHLLPDNLRERELAIRTRKPLESFVFIAVAREMKTLLN
jgi:nitroreductase